MGINDSPLGERIHIAFFGRRNAGKSSTVNAVTGQEAALVSNVPGTTTDPVLKSMELLPLGPVVIIDTPGIDDSGELGAKRVGKTRQILNKADIAVLVIDASAGKSPMDEALILQFIEKKIPYVIAWNKSDLITVPTSMDSCEIYISAKTGGNIHALREKIAHLSTSSEEKHPLVMDLISPGDFVVLVTPIDSAAPKGRIILPQQQTIRDILDCGAVSMVLKETQYKQAISDLGKKPSLVITDSQVFAQIHAQTPPDIPLTSFSILFARYKGILEAAVNGAHTLDTLLDGDSVLIAEGCTHHRQDDDIGTVKLPRLIKKHTGKNIHFAFSSGGSFPDDPSPHRLIIHCGGCMLNQREMKYRFSYAKDNRIPITNYGIAIAHMQGILSRTIAMFPHL